MRRHQQIHQKTACVHKLVKVNFKYLNSHFEVEFAYGHLLGETTAESRRSVRPETTRAEGGFRQMFQEHLNSSTKSL